jgi:hypothetical protein
MLDKLKIGVLDLLTILVPGGFLLFLLSDRIMDFVANEWKGYPLLSSQWLTVGIGFALAYILGHFIFFIGSYLDDLVYEKVRKVYWHHHAKLTAYVLMLKEKKTGISERKVLSAWKWACAWLISNQPAIYAEVERLMAESKFFRCLIVVCIAGIFVFPAEEKSTALIIGFIVLIFLSLIRYLTQRQKSLEAAYHGILTTSDVRLPAQPDPSLLASLKKDQLYPNARLYQKIRDNDNASPGRKIRLDKTWYAVLSFFYSIGLCLIPGFSSLVKGSESRKRVREEIQINERLAQAGKLIPARNKALSKQQKMEN